MSELADLSSHPLAEQFPCRAPVWWGRYGPVEKDPFHRGVSGRKIMLRVPKQFGRMERVLARLLRAPKEVRRPLDSMNSLLWELADGSRTFADICEIMNATFHEAIAPVMHRTAAAISVFQAQNLMLVLEGPLEKRWSVGPGLTPSHQHLEPLDQHLDIDVLPLAEEAP